MTFELYTTPSQKLSQRSIQLPPYQRDKGVNDSSKYIASEELKNAVNVALALGQPLLLTGEPGTGKTQLAANIAWQLELTMEKFHTKSSSKATDLFYHYDSLRHFHDAQLKDKVKIDPRDYIRLQALGKAIVNSPSLRTVVLIDEIDKAPRDFPNDVLNELENMDFAIPELNKHYEVTEQNRPVVVITSNSEKNLPDAFLRRCVFYHIPFPNRDLLFKIVNSRLRLRSQFTEAMKAAAIDHFLQIRAYDLRKKPATAELLSWVHILDKLGIDPKSKDPDHILKRIQTYSVLAKNKDDLDKMVAP
ncbi:MAG: AAA family ATPase [Chitinophagales bacterium]